MIHQIERTKDYWAEQLFIHKENWYAFYWHPYNESLRVYHTRGLSWNGDFQNIKYIPHLYIPHTMLIDMSPKYTQITEEIWQWILNHPEAALLRYLLL